MWISSTTLQASVDSGEFDLSSDGYREAYRAATAPTLPSFRKARQAELGDCRSATSATPCRLEDAGGRAGR